MEQKRDAVRQCILLANTGAPLPPGVLMAVIRFIMTHQDKYLKKLLLLFWETVEKTSPTGALLPEMILVWCAQSFFSPPPPPLMPLAATPS